MWNVECGRRNVGGRGVRSVEGEFGGAGLVDDGDAGGIELWGVVEDVTAGTLADGDDMGGLADGLAELPGVDLRVYPMVIFAAPEGFSEGCGMWNVECGMWSVECGMWSVDGDVGAVLDLGAEIVTTLVGSVEAQSEGVARKVVDEGARVTA